MRVNENNVVTGTVKKCTVVRCMYHAKEARYRVMFVEEDNLLIVQCLECHPPTEILRAAIDTSRQV